MKLSVNAVVEYNDGGYLIYADNFIGAYTRGKTKSEAASKFDKEIPQYILWSTGKAIGEPLQLEIQTIQEKESKLQICDADSDVLFDSETKPLSSEEYKALKALALKSANDFWALYASVPDKRRTSLAARKTFYGEIPRTADEMYEHTKNVNSYYFGEIGVDVKDTPDIVKCREKGFIALESKKNFLKNQIFNGSYDEQWSLRKVMRRFIWHDRIHAKAMYRMALSLWEPDKIKNPFCFLL